MTEHFVWHPVGCRMATPEEFDQRVRARIEAPGIVPTGEQPERGGVYLVTTTNGNVDIDEYGILDGIDDWHWYDCGNVTAWMEFPEFDPEKPDGFWNPVTLRKPTEEEQEVFGIEPDADFLDGLPWNDDVEYLFAFKCASGDIKYDVNEIFLDDNEVRIEGRDEKTLVAWAKLPEPYKGSD